MSSSVDRSWGPAGSATEVLFLRFDLQVRGKTEINPNFGFKRVCEEQSVNFSVFDRKKLSFEIQIFLSTHENHKFILKVSSTAKVCTSNYRGIEGSGGSRA